MDSALTALFLDHRVEILKRISHEFKLDESELLAKYSEPDPIKMICTWKTNRGSLCKSAAAIGYSMRIKHIGKSPPKRKRVHLMHTHKIGETPDTICTLCELYGDPLDPVRLELEIV